MLECVGLIDEVLQGLVQTSNKTYELDPALQASVEARVRAIAKRRPISTYPAPTEL
jgi:hypothetical protein